MAKKFSFFIVLLLAFYCNFIQAQILEDFSDENFTVNPTWTGDDTLFTISTFSSSTWSVKPRLQLNATQAGTAHLRFQNQLSNLDSIEWRFWTRLSLSSGTSITNNARFYLTSDNENLMGPLNGYFIQFGDDNDNAKDSVYLCKQVGTTITKVIYGSVTTTTSSRNVRVKVTRNAQGLWTLLTDSTGGYNYNTEGSAIDNSINPVGYSGVYCKFTSSNKTNFYFDDIYVGYIEKDITPPTVVSVNVSSPNSLTVEFSEVVQQSTLTNVNNYVVDNSVGSPASAVFDPLFPRNITLNFDNEFAINTLYNILISGIKDLSDNEIVPVSKAFSRYASSTWDIVINEIMADPSPVVGLPDAEYVELFNRTNLPINLNGWMLKIGSTTKILPSFEIQPNSYLIICSSANQGLLDPYGSTIAVSSLSFTNDGQTISLISPENNIIHSVTFSITWYQNNLKKDGGWSLEMIDPNNPCAEESNWKASINVSGGTPGAQNSIFAPNPDLINPTVINAVALDLKNVRVFFSERMDNTSVFNLSNFTVNNGIGNPVSIVSDDPNMKFVTITFAQDFQQNTIYNLTITDTITDCVGNYIELQSSVAFAVPMAAQTGDVVINEILSNPSDNGVDYVELYNKSNKFIDLSKLKLGSITSSSTQLYTIAPNGYVMFPNTYVLLTSNTQSVKNSYTTYSSSNFIQMESFPTYNNDAGTVMIQDTNSVNIDIFTYDVSMHYPLLRTTKGVSFERVNPNQPTQSNANWHSASSQVGYGTPGYKNSQYSEFNQSNETFTIEPEVFTPDNDGNNDILFIGYKLSDPGYRANIWIYSSNGQKIKQIVNNDLLSTEGVYSWDGTNEDKLRASAGIYIIFIELWNLDGDVTRTKKTCTLGAKFN